MTSVIQSQRENRLVLRIFPLTIIVAQEDIKQLSNMEWYEWVIPLAFGVIVFITSYVVHYIRCKEYCKFWGLDFKEEWRKAKKT